MKRAYSAGGLVLKREKNKNLLLLVKHGDGFLVFPKGHINSDETKEKAALREVEEETGLSGLKIVKKLGEVARPSKEDTGEVVEKTIYLFLMQTDNFEHKGADEDFGWFTYDEAIEGLGFEQERDFLKKHRQDLI